MNAAGEAAMDVLKADDAGDGESRETTGEAAPESSKAALADVR